MHVELAGTSAYMPLLETLYEGIYSNLVYSLAIYVCIEYILGRHFCSVFLLIVAFYADVAMHTLCTVI